MSYTFGSLKLELRKVIWPNGAPENLVGTIDSYFAQACLDLQRWVSCLQTRNVSLFPHCATYFHCGKTVLDAPRGRITRVATVRGENYCDPVELHADSFDNLLAWSKEFTRLATVPANTGMTALPMGFKYPEASSNSIYGRALRGLWALDQNRRLYVAPWIQSDELVAVEWDGLRRKWADADLVPDEEDYKSAVKLFVQAEFARDFEGDPGRFQQFREQFEDARAILMWECERELRAAPKPFRSEGIELLWENYAAADADSLVPAASTSASPFIFAVIGDYGLDGTPEADVAKLVKGWNPEFVVTTGDNNYPSGEASTIDANIGKHYRKFIYPYAGSQPLGTGEADATKNRFWPCLGNHDLDTVVGGVAGKPYLDYFTLPGNERFYDVVVGNVHLFVLNSGLNTAGSKVESFGNDPLSLQAEQLRYALARSTARWKVVVFHHPAYTSSASYQPGYTDLRWDFKGMGADIVMNGHGHHYERLLVGNLPYIVNGAGGHSLTGFHGTPVSGSQLRYNADYGAIKVSVTCTEFKTEFINRAGAVVDTFTITKS